MVRHGCIRRIPFARGIEKHTPPRCLSYCTVMSTTCSLLVVSFGLLELTSRD